VLIKDDFMKVVIMGKWPDEIYGGVAVHTVNLIENLSKLDGIDLYFISFVNESKTFKMNNARIIFIKSRRIYYFLPVLSLLKLRAEIIKIKPDILQVQGTYIITYLVYALFSFNGVKKIINIYGLMFMESKFIKEDLLNEFHKYILIYFEKYALSRFSNIIVESKYIKKIIQKMTNSNVYIVPDGIDIEKVQVNRSNEKKSDIFLISRLVELKGIDLLIEAVFIVKNKYPKIKVFIAGNGVSINQLKKLTINLKLESNISFLGVISDEEKYQYYKSSKIVVVPSRWDCSPISIFEGLGVGKPVIASSNTNSEILEDGVNGYIFESDNVQDLACKIEILLDNKKLRKEMEVSALKKAVQYSWENIAMKYYDVYREIIMN